MEGHLFARMAPGCKAKGWKVMGWEHEGRSIGRTGQRWHFLSLAPGRPSLKARSQGRRGMFQLLSVCSRSLPSPGQWWGMLFPCEAVLLCQLARKSGWLLQRRG